MRIWSARELQETRAYIGRVPGRVIEVRLGKGTVVLTGDDSILLEKVQFDNEEIVCAADVLNRLSMTLGNCRS